MTTLNVGDAVLYTKNYGARPVAGNVHKVTKTQAKVTLADGTEVGPFKRESFNGHDAIKSESYRSGAEVYPKTPEREAELVSRADRYEQEAAAKKVAEQERQAALAKRLVEEIEEVKSACGSLEGELPPMIKKHMPDGTRLYFASVPVKKELKDRKKGWEEVIVRCKDAEYYDFRNDQAWIGVESYITYTNGSSSSFSSCSGINYADDSEAIWDAIRRCYHSW